MGIVEVARRSGISVATVSRVFNAPGIVNEQTREKVLGVAQELGYVPNGSARALRTRHSKVLGVVLPTLTNPVFAECLQGIAAEAQQRGYAIQPVTTEYCRQREEAAAQRLLAGNVDGLVLVVSNPQASKALQWIALAGKPFVLAYNHTPLHPCVSVDNTQAVRDLIRRLAQAGHERIGMVMGQAQASDRAQQRHKGYVEGMEAAGLKPLPVWEVTFAAGGLDALQQDLAGAAAPTAMVCSNDLLAIRTMRAASLAGLRVPADICVVGFDGIAIGCDLTPSLASITQPNAQIGGTCVRLLCGALGEQQALTPRHSVLLPHGWRAGESCGRLD